MRVAGDALGSTATFVMTVTIIPFMPNGWAPSAGGFPAVVGNVPFLMKDVILLAASIHLLRQDLLRVARSSGRQAPAIGGWHEGSVSAGPLP